MYVEGKPIWEGDELLYMDSNIKKQHMRKVCWQHRGIIISDPNWINSWSFSVVKINMEKKIIIDGVEYEL
jgi:hypothetical protein